MFFILIKMCMETEVKLLHFLRQEMKFENIEALKKQMESDASFAKEMFML